MIPFIDLQSQFARIQPEVEAAMLAVVRSGQFILGPEVAKLEERLADYVGAKHCISCASGTDALVMALMAKGVGPGDAVFTVPFTFMASAEAIATVGATPIFVDVSADSFNMDTAALSRAIEALAKADASIHPLPRLSESELKALTPKGIIAVDLFGLTADYASINQIAAANDLFVIEDAAQSFGALYQGRRSCALSTFGATSFFPSKPLGCYGDGGALFTDDDHLAQAAREIRVHGQSGRYHHTRVGVGGRLDTIQAAVLLAKLERFEWELERRAAIGARYQALLAGVQEVTVRPDRNSVYAQFTVMVDQRSQVQSLLKADGVPTAVHYPKPLNLQPAYAAHCCPDCCPVSSTLAQRVLSLPMSADLTDVDQDHVVQSLKQALGQVGA